MIHRLTNIGKVCAMIILQSVLSLEEKSPQAMSSTPEGGLLTRHHSLESHLKVLC